MERGVFYPTRQRGNQVRIRAISDSLAVVPKARFTKLLRRLGSPENNAWASIV
jgi:hypothetical protein